MTGKRDAWMPLYIGDYLADTGHLTTTEHGAYLLLLMQAWTRSGRLPDDDERLRRMARLTPQEWRRSRDTLRAFWVSDGAELQQPRLTREIARVESVSQERRQAGAIGAEKRWKNKGGDMANANGLPSGLPMANGMAKNSEPQPQEKRIPPDPPSGGQPGGSLFADLPDTSGDQARDEEPLWEVLRLWNEEAHEAAPQVRDLGDKLRRKRIAQFLQRARSLAGARRFFAHIAQQPGLTGQRGDFVAFFDWALRPPVVTRLAEEAGLEFLPEPMEPRRSQQ